MRDRSTRVIDMIKGGSLVTMSALVVVCLGGCDDPSAKRHRLRDDGDQVSDNKLLSRQWPKIPEKHGKQALLRWAEQCRQQGLSHAPDRFSKAGQLVITWAADRNGELLRLNFDSDSYRGWELQSSGQTLAECVVKQARAGKVRWSRQGAAPLRFPPAAPPTSKAGDGGIDH